MSIKSWWKAMDPVEKFNTIVKGVITSIIGIGTAVCIHEVRESYRLVNYAVNKIGDGVDVEVSDRMIEDAVRASAEKQIRKTVQTATDRTWREVQDETKERVSEAVNDARRQITDSVTNKIADECKKMNEHDLMKEIRDKAAEKLANKLDSNLDSITDEYSKNLSNMGKVYEALAEKLQNKA